MEHVGETVAVRAAREVLERGVASRVFSGAQAAWVHRDGELAGACAGATRADGGRPISAQTRFDVASVTKVYTAAAALRLVDRGRLRLESTLGELLPEVAVGTVAAASVAQLLAHEAGFADWAPLFQQIDPADRGTRRSVPAFLRAIFQLGPAAKVGETALYSDLGFIVLGHLLERVAGVALDRLVDAEVCAPLGLAATGFCSLAEPLEKETIEFTATEQCPWRGRLLCGEVHDDNAWAMGGVGGHAGIFAPAADVARLGRSWLRALAGDRWLSAELAQRVVERRPLGRGLGFDLKSETDSSCGVGMGSRTFGHLGFTGCSLWVDPDAELAVALLTNRVHFGRDNLAIRGFRPQFHDALVAAIGAA